MTTHATRQQHYFPIPTRSRQSPYSTSDHHVHTTTRPGESQPGVNSDQRLPPITDLVGPMINRRAPREPDLQRDVDLGLTYRPDPFLRGQYNRNEPQYQSLSHRGGPVQPRSRLPAPVEPRIDSASSGPTSFDHASQRRRSLESEGSTFGTDSYRRSSEPRQHNLFEDGPSMPNTPRSDEPGPGVRTPPSLLSQGSLNEDHSRPLPRSSPLDRYERGYCFQNEPIERGEDFDQMRRSSGYQILQLQSEAERFQGRSGSRMNGSVRTHPGHRDGGHEFSSARYDALGHFHDHHASDSRLMNPHFGYHSHQTSPHSMAAMQPQQPHPFGGMGGLYQPSHHAPSSLLPTYGGPHFDCPYPGRKKPKANHSKNATDILVAWVDAHLDSPYPSDAEKADMSRLTGLDGNQISNWFINRRRRDPRIANAEKGRKRGSQHVTDGPAEKNHRHDRKDRDDDNGHPAMSGAGLPR